MTSCDPSNLDLLFDEYLAGTLTEERASVLLELLKKNPQNIACFTESVMGDFMLTERAVLIRDQQMSLLEENEEYESLRDSIAWRSARNMRISAETPASHDSLAQTKISKFPAIQNKTDRKQLLERQPIWPLILCIIIFLGLIIPVVWEYQNKEKSTHFEMERPFVAKVTELIDPVWEEDSGIFVRGQEIGNNQIALKSGTIGLEFAGGTIAVLEGPVELLFKDSQFIFCSRGKISAYVPPESVGFTIDTPFGSVVDQGTAFYVHVSRTAAQVGVERGRVDFVQRTNQSTLKLERLQTIQIGIDGKLQTQKFEPIRYYDYSDFYQLVEKRDQVLIAEKEQADQRLDNNPNSLARFDFMRNGPNDTQNCSRKGKNIVSNVKPIAVHLGSGPLRSTKSALFHDDASVMSLALPQTLPSLSMAATIRIDRFHSGSNVLFASEKHQSVPGSLLWQILPTGEIQLHIRGTNGNVDYYSIPEVVTRERLGTWFTLGILLDASKKEVVFYVDLKEVSRQKWKSVMPVTLGQASLGNVPTAQQQGESRSLGGAMAEWKIAVP